VSEDGRISGAALEKMIARVKRDSGDRMTFFPICWQGHPARSLMAKMAINPTTGVRIVNILDREGF
jgi:hypothetical protein